MFWVKRDSIDKILTETIREMNAVTREIYVSTYYDERTPNHLKIIKCCLSSFTMTRDQAILIE